MFAKVYSIFCLIQYTPSNELTNTLNFFANATKFRQIWSHCSSWSLKFECAVSWLETKVLLSAAGSVSGSGTSGKKIYVCLVSVQKPSWNRLGKPSITIKDQCQLVKKLRPVLTSKDRLRPFKIGQSLFASLKGGDETGGVCICFCIPARPR